MLLLHRATVLFCIVNQAVDLFIHNVTFKTNIYYNFYLWSYYYLFVFLLFYVTAYYTYLILFYCHFLYCFIAHFIWIFCLLSYTFQ